MNKYIIERHLPKIGDADRSALQQAAIASNTAIATIGTDIQWIQSHVCADRTFCVYLAASEELIHLHAQRSGFPVTRICEVKGIIDPSTAGRSTPHGERVCS